MAEQFKPKDMVLFRKVFDSFDEDGTWEHAYFCLRNLLQGRWILVAHFACKYANLYVRMCIHVVVWAFM